VLQWRFNPIKDRGQSEPDTARQFVALMGMDSGVGGPGDAAPVVHSSLIANDAMTQH
jgi:hypothetical protein